MSNSERSKLDEHVWTGLCKPTEVSGGSMGEGVALPPAASRWPSQDGEKGPNPGCAWGARGCWGPARATLEPRLSWGSACSGHCAARRVCVARCI